MARLYSDQPLLLPLHHSHFKKKKCGPTTVNDETAYQTVTLGGCCGLRQICRGLLADQQLPFCL